MRVETLDFKVFPFKPSLCRASPSLTLTPLHISNSSTFTPLRDPRHHFLLLGSRTNSLPQPIPHCASLTSAKHPQEGHFLLLDSCATPLYVSHLFVACCASHRVVPLSCLWSCQTTKYIYIYIKKLLIKLTNWSDPFIRRLSRPNTDLKKSPFNL